VPASHRYDAIVSHPKREFFLYVFFSNYIIGFASAQQQQQQRCTSSNSRLQLCQQQQQ
jgi:hypothetical protein